MIQFGKAITSFLDRNTKKVFTRHQVLILFSNIKVWTLFSKPLRQCGGKVLKHFIDEFICLPKTKQMIRSLKYTWIVVLNMQVLLLRVECETPKGCCNPSSPEETLRTWPICSGGVQPCVLNFSKNNLFHLNGKKKKKNDISKPVPRMHALWGG